MKKIILLSLVVFVIICGGCSKEEKYEQPPEVQLILPAGNSVFNVYDTIFIKAQVSHHSVIRRIDISVRDSDLKPVLASKTVEANDREVLIETFIPVDNKYIYDDEHFLLIEIEDDDNLFKEWYQIEIQPLTKELENVVYVSGEGNERELFILSNELFPTKIAQWNSEYLGGYVDSRYRQFYTSGSLVDGIRCYDIDNKELKWSIPVKVSGTLPYFTAFSAIDGRVAVATREGSIECYDQNGLRTCMTPKRNNGKYHQVLLHGDFVMGLFSQFSGTSEFFDVYNYPSGTLYQSLEIPGDPVNISTLDDDKVILFTMLQYGCRTYNYSPFNKSLGNLQDISVDRIIKVAGKSGNFYLLDSTGVIWYQPETRQASNIIYYSSYSGINYDPYGNILYLADGNEINYYLLPYAYETKSYDAGKIVNDVLLLFNR